MTSMTYGTLPTLVEFTEAFDRECPNGTYNIHLGASDSRAIDNFSLGDGDWKARELYLACTEIVCSDGDIPEQAMDLVSSIMSTLGFEWI